MFQTEKAGLQRPEVGREWLRGGRLDLPDGNSFELNPPQGLCTVVPSAGTYFS